MLKNATKRERRVRDQGFKVFRSVQNTNSLYMLSEEASKLSYFPFESRNVDPDLTHAYRGDMKKFTLSERGHKLGNLALNSLIDDFYDILPKPMWSRMELQVDRWQTISSVGRTALMLMFTEESTELARVERIEIDNILKELSGNTDLNILPPYNLFHISAGYLDCTYPPQPLIDKYLNIAHQYIKPGEIIELNPVKIR